MDVSAIRAKAREEWETRQKKRIPLQEKIGLTVPWWLIIVAGVFFALSVPHTAVTFDVITPGVGYIAPLGVEFGLLYTSFRKRQLRTEQRKGVPGTVLLLEVLLFVVAVIVNGVGTLQAVADNAGLHEQSTAEVISSFADMSATEQVALILVPLAALIIPIGTMVAGEGLAGLFLENANRRENFDEQWDQVAAQVEFEALRDAAINEGYAPRQAVSWARQIVQLSGNNGQADADRTAERTPGEPSNGRGNGTGRGYTKRMDARTVGKQYLIEHPEAIELSVRTFAERAGIGHSTAGEILKEANREFTSVRFGGNGSGKHGRENNQDS